MDKMTARVHWRWQLATVLWLAAVIGGVAWLNSYAATAGAPPTATIESWPDDTPLGALGSGGRLVVFAHPRCPCTRATIRNLAGLLATPAMQSVAPAVTFLFWRPDSTWKTTDLWDSAAAIPHSHCLWDDGTLTSRFGATTSGHAMIFAPSGSLLFAGGLTASRGHEGPSAGIEAVRAWLRGEAPEGNAAPTYGCPILTSGNDSAPASAR